MFSLVITIVSIALVAVIAVATLFYGGDAFRQGTADAKANTVLSQGQQLLAASKLYYNDKNVWPPSVEALVSGGYLTAKPVIALGPLPNALAAEGEWTMPVPGTPVFLNQTDNPQACRNLNQKSYGSPGILNTVLRYSSAQCFGKSLSNLSFVASLSGDHLLTVAQSGAASFTTSDLRTGTIPADTETTAWLVRPSDPAVTEIPRTELGGGSGTTEPEPPPAPLPPFVSLTAPEGTNFYSVALGQSKTMDFTLSNTGQGPATGIQPSISGAPEFAVVGNTCDTQPAPGLLEPQATCTISVQFTPSVQQFYYGNLVIASNDPNSPHSLAMEGFGATPATLSLSSTSLTLKALPTLTSTQRLTVTNSGALGNLTLNELTFSGSYLTKFTKGGTGCAVGTQLAPGASCFVDVTFTPGNGAGMSMPGTLRIGHSANATPADVTLAADSLYTPAVPSNIVGTAPTITGGTISWAAGAANVGVSAGNTFHTAGKFTVEMTGTMAHLNKVQHCVNTNTSGGYYCLDFNTKAVVTDNKNIVSSAQNTTLGATADNQRILTQIDYSTKTVTWHRCDATTCTQLATVTSNAAIRPYIWKYLSDAVTLTMKSSNIANIPNSTTFHIGLPQ